MQTGISAQASNRKLALKILKIIKTQTAFFRIKVAILVLWILTFIHLVFDIGYFGIKENLSQKLILIVFQPIYCFLFIKVSENPESSIYFSLVLAEITNAVLVYYTYALTPGNESIWIQLAIVVTFVYEGFLFSDYLSLIIFSLKQTLIWVGAGVYYNKIIFDDPIAVGMGILSLPIFYFVAILCDYAKDMEMCESKLKVEQAQQKISNIVEAISDAILVINSEFEVMFSNSSAKDMLKSYSIQEYLIKSKYHRRYFPIKNREQGIYNDVQEVFKGKINTETNFGVSENNSEFTEWKGKLIDWDGKVSMIMSGRNVTKLLMLEKESSENAYKSTLLRTVSHELRTPINAILAMTQIIQLNDDISKDIQDKLDIILGSCNYQLCLINDLLDYAQIVAGSLKISSTPFSLYTLLNECLKLISIQLREKPVELKLLLKDIPLEIINDPHRLKQIVLNLLSNACKFTISGSITLEANYTDNLLTIKCKDTGIGIPPDKFSLLFTQYGKIDSSFSLNPQGIGLGLTISNMLVKELGGEGLKVESDLNKGSCFYFILPTKDHIDEVKEMKKMTCHMDIDFGVRSSCLAKRKVLVVDDTYFNIMAIVHILQSEGIKCSYVLNGYDAIEKIRVGKYDWVLMDCEMPIMDGWETTMKIKEMVEKGEIKKAPPIIALTAHSSQEIRDKCLGAGMDEVIVKPCEKNIVVDVLKRFI
ncbi:hypothetical protein SteCoe_36614 [Stentor coeruleus]|uniref:Histidine kinase n=1 Tax=Stentor coeruleus TaxID=5963 RepID=A0A1R2APQ8_9CILI|nr:hypothetical protein SteCoe_36614 [Stentor coeruleus]